MDSNEKNFHDWYVGPLRALYPVRKAGIAVLMISTPLLERYLRQKNGLTPQDNLTDSCMGTLQTLFPLLLDVRSARRFWHVFRDGFLHQATLNQTYKGVTLPSSELTHDILQSVVVNQDGSFVVHPVFFSKRIIETIQADFKIYVGAGTSAPKLPQVVAYVAPATNSMPVPPIVLKTST